MRNLKTYSRKYYEYTDSSILNDILHEVKGFKPNCNFCDNDVYENEYMFWFVYKYTAKNKRDAINKVQNLYEENRKLIISKLESMECVDVVEIDYRGRFVPFKYNSNYGGQQRANESVYEVKCYINEKYLPEILDEIDAKKMSKKYNL